MAREQHGPCECEECPCGRPSDESRGFICDDCIADAHQPERELPPGCPNCGNTGFTVIDGAHRPCLWDHAA
jgi:hypothetical protein